MVNYGYESMSHKFHSLFQPLMLVRVALKSSESLQRHDFDGVAFSGLFSDVPTS
jgi:hypothetical protein